MSYTDGVGYPDWERVVTQVAHPLIAETAFPGKTNFTSTLFFVGAFPTTKVALVHGSYAHTATLEFVWYVTVTKTIEVDNFIWTTTTGVGIFDAVANLGPYLEVRYVGNGVNVGSWARLIVTATTSTQQSARATTTKTVANFYEGNVGGSDTVTAVATQVTTGPAIFFASSTASAWSAVLFGATGGTGNILLGLQNATTAKNTRSVAVYLPSQLVKISMTNATAGAKSFSASLTIP